MSDQLGDKRPGPEASALRAAEVSPGQRSLLEILERLPTEPGVYVMKDRRGKILYIGKAASLRTRVRQYFQPNTGDIRDFVPLLEGIVADIETTVTSNEKEALLLENTLIKKHQPRFNVKLRDDKNYLVLRLDPEASWPRLEVVRRIQDDGAHYFGPYHSASSCREALRVVNRHFQLRTCTDHVLANRRRPCLQYQIKRCPAPCVLPVPREEYGEQVRDVRLFLDGKNEELLDRLRGRMKESATRTEFERAALVRDQIRALESTLQAQRVVSTDFVDQDVIGFHREGIALEIAVIAIRQGKMAGTRCFSFTDQEFPDAEILSSFVGLYYDLTPGAPDEVLLPFAIADAELKADWLTELRAGLAEGGGRRRRVEVLVPQRATRRELVELAQKNAAASFASRRNRREDAEAMLAKLQKRLRLPRLPRTIECYDISHVQGSETVASMVVFIDGKPEKTRYRTYKLQRGGVGSPDDFASMYEVLSRRFRRAREAAAEAQARGEPEAIQDSPWALPDLIVVDGGKGQLGMALAAARDVGIDVRPGVGLPIVGLAKERDPQAGVEMAVAAEEAPAPGMETAVAGEAPPAPAAGPPTEAVLLDAPPGESLAPEPPADCPPDGSSPAPGAGTLAPVVPPPVEDAPTPPPGGSRRRGKKQAESSGRRPDRVFLAQAKDPIPIRPNSAEMFVLAHLRDEAHRFAVAFHRGQRRRRTLRSALSDIEGIGVARQRELLRHFGSVRKIREASVEDLAAVPGVSHKTAEAVRAYFEAHGELAQTTPDAAADTPAPSVDAPVDAQTQPDEPLAEQEAEEDALESAFAEVEEPA
jgi:excinuclease ABC subunit C